MNRFCLWAIYNGRLWDKELRVSVHKQFYIGLSEMHEQYSIGPSKHLCNIYGTKIDSIALIDCQWR